MSQAGAHTLLVERTPFFLGRLLPVRGQRANILGFVGFGLPVALPFPFVEEAVGWIWSRAIVWPTLPSRPCVLPSQSLSQSK